MKIVPCVRSLKYICNTRKKDSSSTYHGKLEEKPLTTTIQSLKKVTLLLTTGSNTSEPVSFTFIYGIASGGLCPFEQTLQDKKEGENLNLTVTDSEVQHYFSHLFLPLRQALGLTIMPKILSLRVAISAVKDADNREVVQSLAKAASGCGGSCGCGCS